MYSVFFCFVFLKVLFWFFIFGGGLVLQLNVCFFFVLFFNQKIFALQNFVFCQTST